MPVVESAKWTVVISNYTISCGIQDSFTYRAELWEDKLSPDRLVARNEELTARKEAVGEIGTTYNEGDFPTSFFEFYLLIIHNCGNGKKNYRYLKPHCKAGSNFCEYHNIHFKLD